MSEALAGHDLVLVVGASVFSYYPNIPGPLLPDGAQLVAVTSDPDEAARAPMGDAIVADVALTLEALLEQVGESDRPQPEARPAPEPARRTAARGAPSGEIHACDVANRPLGRLGWHTPCYGTRP